MNLKNAKKLKIGQWVRVKWNDVGVQDSVLIRKNIDCDDFQVFNANVGIGNVERSQIVEAGKLLVTENTGLS